ncbi:hypothetical protein J1N35_017564 [Gossypium stocksii]|uniref:Cytosolic iron-sulfur protein assembly protein CIAO1 homolog n=1 Tax=Gossypium stocksii TaxID=47602 RepID=A0A9D4A459_9ROSI|nr:hypothetical protein J1N35_017564 [Gossypium stocksii]
MVRWHPTMDILFSCSYDNTAKVWWSEDTDGDRDCVQTLGESSNGHSSTVWSLAFNAKGDKLFDVKELIFAVWNFETSGIICALSQVFMIEQSFQFTGQDGIITSGAADDAVRLKNVYLLLQEQGVEAGNFVLIRIP